MATISKCRQVVGLHNWRWSNARNITRLGGSADDVNLKIALVTYLTAELNVKFNELHGRLDAETRGDNPELVASMAVTFDAPVNTWKSSIRTVQGKPKGNQTQPYQDLVNWTI